MTDNLPEDWDEQDSRNTFFEYCEMVREDLRKGKPLPEFFRSMYEVLPQRDGLPMMEETQSYKVLRP